MITPEVLTEIALSAVLFVFFWLFLGQRILKPFLSLIEERESRSAGRRAQAHEMRKAARALAARIEEVRREAVAEGTVLKNEHVQQGRLEAQAILGRAAKAAELERRQALGKIESLERRARAEVPTEVEKLANLVTERAMRLNGNGAVH